MGKKWSILFCIFSMLTLISSIAYNIFLVSNDKNRTELNSNSVLASNNIYNKIYINYESDNHLNLSNLLPAQSVTKTFSITNNNSKDISYSIVWDNITSTWGLNHYDSSLVHPEEFLYTLSCTDGTTITNQMPINNDNNIILDNLTLKSNSINTCIINIEFTFLEKDQSYNFNKIFEGTYKVVINRK